MNSLKGAKILMFYPFGATKHYGESIKSELIKRGAFVVGYDERPSQKPIIKVIIRLFKKKVPSIFSIYIRKIIQENIDKDFDYILVLRGEAFTESTVNLLKNAYKKATLILYVWDILKSIKLQDVIPFFDKAYSFDPEDAKNNKGLIFRPTFFMPQYEHLIPREYKENDIVFIGTLHSNRYHLLKTLKDYMIRNNISFYSYLYVPSKIALIKNRIIDKIPVSKKDVHFSPISLETTLKIVANSKCILDLNFSGQKSLSMRAFESMASRTKYITTNQEIKKYDFYNEKNILVIDVENINIPLDFINSPFEEISSSIFNKYSVERLTEDIFFSSIGPSLSSLYFRENQYISEL